jgi:hypothetical protein
VGRPLDFFFGSCGGCSDINHSLSLYSPKSNSSRANQAVVAWLVNGFTHNQAGGVVGKAILYLVVVARHLIWG